MTRLRVTQTIECSASHVWKLLSDYPAISKWNPNLSGSRWIQGGTAQGVGALRHCDMADGKNWIRERITEWDEGRAYSVDIYDGTMPLKTAVATVGVEPLGATRSEAFMELEYEPKMGPLGALMNVLMMKSMMRKSMARLLEGLSEASLKAGA